MARSVADPSRAAVAFGRWSVPLLFRQLQEEGGSRVPVLASLCDLIHDPERLCQTVTGGFLEQLKVLLKDPDPSVRTKTCELLQVLTRHSIGRQAVFSSSLLPPLSELLDDSSSSCRRNVLLVLDSLAQLPAGAHALLPLVPTLILKLRQEEEEEQEEVLLLSILSCCSRVDALPALASGGVSLLGHKLAHRSLRVRREAAAALMALSVPLDGKQQVCEQQLLPDLLDLLQDEDLEVRTNAAGVIMNVVVITAGKLLSLDVKVLPVLLDLLSESPEEEEERRRRKALVLYLLRALTSLAEAPVGRRLLQEQLPLLERRSQDQDQDIRRAAQTTIKVLIGPASPEHGPLRTP
ncbi:radial spoke head 14 homolog [Austrofundulus limnaeus]|uniref:Radial spoke head 14 homolog n=1 Tax=Austrofundulus limnaeus TaxID=52670 RepID=A0A2I4CE05_AUSLI|nr:PREDICTED: radial spoke head 14 homolog [Austrofundulus limnaeus]